MPNAQSHTFEGLIQLSRGGLEKRVSIAAPMREVYGHIWKHLPKEDTFPDVSSLRKGSLERKRAIRDWMDTHEIRKITRTLVGKYTDEIWSTVKSYSEYSNPPAELSRIISIGNKFEGSARLPVLEWTDDIGRLDALKHFVKSVINFSVGTWSDEVNSLPDDDPRKQVYQWFSKVNPLVQEAVDVDFDPNKEYTVESLLRGGFTSGVVGSFNSIFLRPEVYKAHKNELGKNERRPIEVLPMLQRFSMGSQSIVPALFDALERKDMEYRSYVGNGNEFLYNPFDPSYFTIKEYRGQLVLDLTDDAVQTIRNKAGKRFIEMEGLDPLTGCPAGYTPAIRELYDWSERLYKQFNLPQVEYPKPLFGLTLRRSRS